MIRVIIESPFAGDKARNEKYLGICVRDCLMRGESPYASHAFFTQFLEDNLKQERELGIRAGLEWAKVADKVVFYTDYGMSPGMTFALNVHVAENRVIEYRQLF